VCHAGGVADGQAAHAQLCKALGPAQHLGLGHIAFHRASETAGQRHVHGHATFGHADDLVQAGKALVARHAQVGQVVRFRSRHDQVQLVGARLQCTLGATHVGHQHGGLDAGHAADAAHHLFGVAQHRYRLGGGEGRDLYLGVATGAELVDQGHLGIGRHEGGFVLEAVACNDFIEVDACHGRSRLR
jgi:hypothetical protein